MFHGSAFRFGPVVQEYAVPEYGWGKLTNVLVGYVGAAVPESQGLCSENQCLGRAGAGSPIYPLLDKFRGALVARSGSGGEPYGVADDFLGYRNLADQLLKGHNVLAGKYRDDSLGEPGRSLLYYGGLIVFRQVIDQDVEEESIQLRFGQRVGSLHFQWILCGQYKKRLGKEMPFPGRGDLMLLHGFEQGSLGFGRGAIDFVGQDDVGEDGSFYESEGPSLWGFRQDFGPRYIRRHQIGGELDALEFQSKDLRHRFYQERFGQAWGPGDEAVPAANQGEQDLVDHGVLADDHLTQLPFYFFTTLLQQLESR